jgi:hypothetical protein
VDPQLYNASGDKQAVLDNIIKETARIKRVVNGEFTFSFEAFEKELKSEYFDPDNNIVIDGQTFDIKYIEQSHDKAVRYAIQCEHANYRMKDGSGNVYVSYANTGTPTEILTDILSGTDFSVGTVDFTDPISISVNTEITRKDLIYELVNSLGGEIEYTDSGFEINILDTLGQNNGFEVRFGKNLKGLTKIIDARGTLTTYYEIDLLELKNSNEYIQKDLQDLEVIEIGDTIKIIDSVIGLEVENRVISIEYNPIYAKTTKLEIANTIELITDKINQIETNAVQQDRLYNNAAISTDYGFRATRSDLLARSTMGGGNISLDVGDGLGGYTPAMFFDVLSGKYKFIGDIEASGTITGADFIGGTINIGSGTFQVDNSGNCTANSLTIGGGSGIANLTDAGDLATENTADFATQVSGAQKPDNNATVGANWNTNLLNIPNTLETPSGSGLFLSSTHLGYYQSGTWKTYMDNSGNFYLGGVGGKLQWDAGTNSLIVNGTMTAGSITSTSTINVVTDLTVGDNINIGSPTTGDTKEIIFYNGSSSAEDAQITVSRDNYPTDLYTHLQISSYDISLSSFNRPSWGGSDLVIEDDLDDYATESWVEANHNLDTITGGTGITIGGTATDRTVALNTTYTDGRYAFYNTVQTCIGAGTGGSKTIDYINATGTGLVIWFTDSTNETILYS